MKYLFSKKVFLGLAIFVFMVSIFLLSNAIISKAQIVESFCGNGVVEEGEECDDGNIIDNDVCSNLCILNECKNDLDIMIVMDRSGSMDSGAADSNCRWENLELVSDIFTCVSYQESGLTEQECLAKGDDIPQCPIDPVYIPAQLSKFNSVKQAANDFLSNLGINDQSALVSFADDASLDQILTNNHSNTQTKINSLATGGMTNIGDAINLANIELVSANANSQANKIIILLTDGIANRPVSVPDPEIYAEEKAIESAVQNIKIFTIGLGSDINVAMLQNIAGNTGGEYCFAPTGEGLDAIFDQISNSICELEDNLYECGNGVVEAGEECDDGNNINGDGCNKECMLEEASCDDGIINGGESDIDCGGPCGPCSLDSHCEENIDCLPGFYCYENICAFPPKNIDFNEIDFGKLKLNITKMISGNMIFLENDLQPTIKNETGWPMKWELEFDDMGMGSTDLEWNLKYYIKVGEDINWTTFEPYQPFSIILQPGEIKSISPGVKVFNFPPYQDIFNGIATVAGYEIPISLTMITGGGNPPIVQVKWEMSDSYGFLSGLDDDTDAGAQFNYWTEEGRDISICAVATDFDGVGDINGVYASVYAPEEIGGLLIGRIALTKLNKADAYNLFCDNIRSLNSNLPTFNSVNTYNEICAADGALNKEFSNIYCGDFSLPWGQGGYYRVDVFAQDRNGIHSDYLSNYLEYQQSEIEPYCGDGVVNQPDEQCDGEDGCNNDICVWLESLPQCSDGIDNDGDGKFDMFDIDCFNDGDNYEGGNLPVALSFVNEAGFEDGVEQNIINTGEPVVAKVIYTDIDNFEYPNVKFFNRGSLDTMIVDTEAPEYLRDGNYVNGEQFIYRGVRTHEDRYDYYFKASDYYTEDVYLGNDDKLFYVVNDSVDNYIPDDGSLIIRDNTTGGDCIEIGIWDGVNKICVMNRDYAGRIFIAADNITLDGNGHELRYEECEFSVAEQNSIILTNRTSGVMIKNINFYSCFYAVKINYSNYLTIKNNQFYSLAEPVNGLTSSGIYFYGKNKLPRNKGHVVEDNFFDLPNGVPILGDMVEDIIVRKNTIEDSKNAIILNSVAGNYDVTDNIINKSEYGINVSVSDYDESQGKVNNNKILISSGYGINASGLKNCEVISNESTTDYINKNARIWLQNIENCVIKKNIVYNVDGPGLWVEGDYNLLEENNMHDIQGYGISVNGSNNTIQSNTVSDNTLGGLNIYGDDNVVAYNQIRNNSGSGILASGERNSITVNTIDSCVGGISAIGYNFGSIQTNGITNNSGPGIELKDSSNNVLHGTLVTGNPSVSSEGLYIKESNNNQIKNHIIENVNRGIIIESSKDNNIKDNYVRHASANCFYYTMTAQNEYIQNIVARNNFIDCGIKPYSFMSFYDIMPDIAFGTLEGGNYWSDFDESWEGCLDLNNDGFCDMPYYFVGEWSNVGDYKPYTRENYWLGDNENQPPVITVNPQIVNWLLGVYFPEAEKLKGVEAADPEDGQLYIGFDDVAGTVDGDTPGIYYLYYNKTDSLGLPAAEAVRTVIVGEDEVEEPIDLSAPINLQAIYYPAIQDVTLQWSWDGALSEIDGFKVYRKLFEGAIQELGVTTNIYYFDNDVPVNTPITYYVKAYLGTNESNYSDLAAVYTGVENKFNINDRVRVFDGPLNVRLTAGGTILGTQITGALGTVTDGPIEAGGYMWWNVDYDQGFDGWSAENFIEKYTAEDSVPGAFSLSLDDVYCDTNEPAVKISWTLSENVERYYVYRGDIDENNLEFYANVETDTEFVNEINLEAGKTYFYQVKAINEFGETMSENYVEVEILEGVCGTPVLPQCSDGIDNDGDGRIDFNDIGCHPTIDLLDYSLFSQETYSANNNSENASPFIEIIGDEVINMSIVPNSCYADLGVNTSDEEGHTVVLTVEDDVDVTKAGTYTVVYTATDSQGAVEKAVRTVNVNATPMAEFDVGVWNKETKIIKVGEDVLFDASRSAPVSADAPIKNYEWLISKDGSFELFDTIEPILTTYSFSEPGIYNVQLIITDELNRSVATSTIITVYTHRVLYVPIEFVVDNSKHLVATTPMSELQENAKKLFEYYLKQSYKTAWIGWEFLETEQQSGWIEVDRKSNFLPSNSDSGWGATIGFDNGIWPLNGVLGDTVDKLTEDGILKERTCLPLTCRQKHSDDVYDSIIFLTAADVRAFASGIPGYYVMVDEKSSSYGVWSHELGHSIFGLIDRYDNIGGETCSLDLMSCGVLPPQPISIFNKVNLGWLTYTENAGYGSYVIPFIEDLEYGATVHHFISPDKDYPRYIYEGRTNGIYAGATGVFLYQNIDSFWGDSKLYVIPSLSMQQRLGVTGACTTGKIPSLRPGESYEDIDLGVRFTLGTSDIQLFVTAEHLVTTNTRLIRFWPYGSSGLNTILSPRSITQHFFDIDLHVIDSLGRKVGMNYVTGEYEINIPGAKTSGNLPGGGPEWIAVPKDISISSYVDSVPAKLWADEIDVELPELSTSIQVVVYDEEGGREKSKVDIFDLTVGEQIMVSNSETPISIYIIDGMEWNTFMYTDSVFLSLKAVDNDGVGVEKIEYSFDDEDWLEYTGTTTVSAEGKYTIYYRSTDWFGNVEEPKSVTFEIVSAYSLLQTTQTQLEKPDQTNPIKQAIKQLEQALTKDYWQDNNTLTKKGGQNVFAHLKNAIRHLEDNEDLVDVKNGIELAMEILLGLNDDDAGNTSEETVEPTTNSSSGGGGGSAIIQNSIVENSVQATNITKNSATINWRTPSFSTSKVVFSSEDEDRKFDSGNYFNYGYADFTDEDLNKVIGHQITLTGLQPGTTYYYRCVSAYFPEIISQEYSFTTKGEREKVKVLGIQHIDTSDIDSLYGLEKDLVDLISLEEAKEVYNHNNSVELTEENQAIFDKLIKDYELSEEDKNSIAYFIQVGTQTTKRLGAGERAGVINSYFFTFGIFPESVLDWQDIIKIANGRWPSKVSIKDNTEVSGKFVKVYKREQKRNNQNDEAAMAIMIYGLRSANRNMDSEGTAIKTFIYIFGHNPKTAVEWDTVRAIAYSGSER